jgi:hypothetical protein
MNVFTKTRMLALLLASAALPGAGQVFTVAPEAIDGKYIEFHPTDIPLSSAALTNHNRQDLLRFLQAEQGFAMRPLPIAKITLRANGMMEPNGSDYINALRAKGLSTKAGDRVIITDVKIDKSAIELDFNGGPEHKHKFLRHISIGMDPSSTTSIVKDDPGDPTGSRITLVFPHGVPDVTGPQVEALLKPIVDFNFKSPQQAYTDTLPPFLRKAILAHQVLVGMNHDMVINALGRPRDKLREGDGQTQFEEWIYGNLPDPVQFVRFQGNRVVRVELAKVGAPIEVRTQSEMGDYWSTQQPDNARIVKLGDPNPADNAQQNAAQGPPTLRSPGESLPPDKNADTPQMGPVVFPKGQQQPGTATGQPASGQASPAPPAPTSPASGQPPPTQPPTNQLSADARPAR